MLEDASSEDSEDDDANNEKTIIEDDEWHEDDQSEDELIIDGVRIEESNEDFNFDTDVDQVQLAGVDTGDGDNGHPSIQLCDFKIVADNIDKNVRPSYQRINRQTVSLHYVHALAVYDRIDFLALSDVVPSSIHPLYYHLLLI